MGTADEDGRLELYNSQIDPSAWAGASGQHPDIDNRRHRPPVAWRTAVATRTTTPDPNLDPR
ncbi:MAG: hypothetical protein NZ700_11175 [Gemmataceae bacterium]|nr:hypothetical protein [Gemmataceae bacterium]MDW8267194.1 hypothetical protein [Gemmataceae bacterium]